MFQAAKASYEVESEPGLSAAEVDLPVGEVHVGSWSVRAGVRESHVRILAEVESELPPILVSRETHQIIDGVHRYRAAILLGRSTIRCVLFDGHADDAVLEAIYRNVEHGLPLTLFERQEAALRVLRLHNDWSDRRIARVCGLAAGTVSRLRQRSNIASEQTDRRQGIDGRSRPTNHAELRRRTEEVLLERPAASIREVANLVGASPSTVKAVRDRLRGKGAAAPQPYVTGADRSIRSTGTGDGLNPRVDPLPGSADVVQLTVERDHLRRWSADPALTATANAAAFTDWFECTNVANSCVDDWPRYFAAIPLSRTYEVVDEARRRAELWKRFASELERRPNGATHAQSRSASG